MFGKANAGHTLNIEDKFWASSLTSRNILHDLFAKHFSSTQHALRFQTGEKPGVETLALFRFNPKKTMFSEFSYNEPHWQSADFTWTKSGKSNVQDFVKCLANPRFVANRKLSDILIDFKDAQGNKINASDFKHNKKPLKSMVVECHDYTYRKKDSISGHVSTYTAEIPLEMTDVS